MAFGVEAFGVWGLRFETWGSGVHLSAWKRLGLWVLGLGFGVWGLGCGVRGLGVVGFGGLGVGVRGSEFRDSGLKFKV